MQPNQRIQFRRDLFEIETAKNMSRDEVVSTFVATSTYWRLLSAKNHIILGARGSGKTVLAKMLSHDHLSRFTSEPRAVAAIRSRSFIGIYVATMVPWVGVLKSKPWQSEPEQERFFQWRLNISCCIAFLSTLRSCLEAYISDIGERTKMERRLSSELAASWLLEDLSISSLPELEHALQELDRLRLIDMEIRRAMPSVAADRMVVGVAFDVEALAPLRWAIRIVSGPLELPETCTWLLCLDEAEWLDPLHHRILNTFLRSASDHLLFKITTTPYHHYTLETNTNDPIAVGHDFEYVYIDRDPVSSDGESADVDNMQFANQLFAKRYARRPGVRRRVSMNQLLGESELLDAGRVDWKPGSRMRELLRIYGSRETVARADRLDHSSSQFSDQLGRKLHGALLLKDGVAQLRGREELTLYSGASTVVRCSDANPRRLVQLFNRLLQEAPETRGRGGKQGRSPGRPVARPLIRPVIQTRVLTTFSQNTLMRIQGEPVVGRELYAMMQAIGGFMRDYLHHRPLSTDQVSSVEIDKDIDPHIWSLVKAAVGLGLLYPNVSARNPDQMPEREGRFHLAYALAPYFRLLPRRGRARKLSTMLEDSGQRDSTNIAQQTALFELDEVEEE